MNGDSLHLSSRRAFVLTSAGAGLLWTKPAEPIRPLVIGVRVLLDKGAHSGHGLTHTEIATFKRYQDQAVREFAVSGIFFDVSWMEDAYLRTQGYSQIPDKFLDRRVINLFVTSTLAYDIDRDRTGGCSIGPGRRPPAFTADPFYKIFVGLREARESTLPHEYAHHFTLDTRRNPTASRNLWADLRNDYWLWRQREGIPIPEFRACAGSEWARFQDSPPTR